MTYILLSQALEKKTAEICKGRSFAMYSVARSALWKSRKGLESASKQIELLLYDNNLLEAIPLVQATSFVTRGEQDEAIKLDARIYKYLERKVLESIESSSCDITEDEAKAEISDEELERIKQRIMTFALTAEKGVSDINTTNEKFRENFEKMQKAAQAKDKMQNSAAVVEVLIIDRFVKLNSHIISLFHDLESRLELLYGRKLDDIGAHSSTYGLGGEIFYSYRKLVSCVLKIKPNVYDNDQKTEILYALESYFFSVGKSIKKNYYANIAVHDSTKFIRNFILKSSNDIERQINTSVSQVGGDLAPLMKGIDDILKRDAKITKKMHNLYYKEERFGSVYRMKLDSSDLAYIPLSATLALVRFVAGAMIAEAMLASIGNGALILLSLPVGGTRNRDLMSKIASSNLARRKRWYTITKNMFFITSAVTITSGALFYIDRTRNHRDLEAYKREHKLDFDKMKIEGSGAHM